MRATRLLNLIILAIFLTLGCAPVKFAPTDTTNFDSTGHRIYRGQLTVSASRPNPPLDLFFIIDNSASMLGHQIDLGNAFSTIFNSNTTNLSNFDTNIYIFSTASTVNGSYLTQIPTNSPASIMSIPNTFDTAGLAPIPGSIFGLWNTPTGAYMAPPFTEQFFPAPVLDVDSDLGKVTPALFLGKRGLASDLDYGNTLAKVTQKFQHRLGFLNPTNQLSYEPLTDISSGLCSMARVLAHPGNFIQAGDSAAFILVSDDNDRLNVRNPNGNQCSDGIVGTSSIVDGVCGHYTSDFSYSTGANINYQSDSKFSFESGSVIDYSYPSSETCHFNYSDGFNFSWTYTQIQTLVTYDRCNAMGDNTCINKTVGVVATINGSFASGNGPSCTQNMAGYVDSPAPGTSFSCAPNLQAGIAGASGVDGNSNGSQCSAQLIGALGGDPTKTNINCVIGARHMTSGSVGGQALNSCASFCASNGQYASCSLTSQTVNRSGGSLAVPANGLQCGSQCPNAAVCGNGTIANYLSGRFGSLASCDGVRASTSVITIDAGANSNGTAFDCNSGLSGLNVKDESNNVVCAGAANVGACIASLQTGTNTISPSCSDLGGDQSSISATVNVGCATTCANSNGLCSPAQDATVGSYLARTSRGYCENSSNGGTAGLSLRFKNNIAANANCSSLCRDTLSGSCDGQGFGAADNSTVGDYISQRLSGANTCSVNTYPVGDTANFAADPANTAASCKNANSPVFFPSDSPHAGPPVTNFVAGDATHNPRDLRQYIVSQSTQVLGPNNPPAVGVITQLPGDNLLGTDVGTEYIGLAGDLNSTQVTSIKGDYSAALSKISDFIVKTTQNSFALSIPATQSIFSVSIMRVNTSTWVPVDSSLWTWSGQTLHLNSSSNLQIGDQIMYQYKDVN